MRSIDDRLWWAVGEMLEHPVAAALRGARSQGGMLVTALNMAAVECFLRMDRGSKAAQLIRGALRYLKEHARLPEELGCSACSGGHCAHICEEHS